MVYHQSALSPSRSVALPSTQISRKAELRSRLAELLLQQSGLQHTLGTVAEGNKEKMKRQV